MLPGPRWGTIDLVFLSFQGPGTQTQTLWCKVKCQKSLVHCRLVELIHFRFYAPNNLHYLIIVQYSISAIIVALIPLLCDGQYWRCQEHVTSDANDTHRVTGWPCSDDATIYSAPSSEHIAETDGNGYLQQHFLSIGFIFIHTWSRLWLCSCCRYLLF